MLIYYVISVMINAIIFPCWNYCGKHEASFTQYRVDTKCVGLTMRLVHYRYHGFQLLSVHFSFIQLFLNTLLLSVQDDVIENSFNVLRMFVRICGASKAPTMLVSMPGSSSRFFIATQSNNWLSVNRFESFFSFFFFSKLQQTCNTKGHNKHKSFWMYSKNPS